MRPLASVKEKGRAMRGLQPDEAFKVNLLSVVDQLHELLQGFPRRVRVSSHEGRLPRRGVELLDLTLEFGPLLFEPGDPLLRRGREGVRPGREPRSKGPARVRVSNKVDADLQPPLLPAIGAPPPIGRQLREEVHRNQTMVTGGKRRNLRARDVLQSFGRRVDAVQARAAVPRKECVLFLRRMASAKDVRQMLARRSVPVLRHPRVRRAGVHWIRRRDAVARSVTDEVEITEPEVHIASVLALNILGRV